MQFRYLKSFKKHRLNHALERLHGKFERRFAQGAANCRKDENTNATGIAETNNNNEMVTSSNETLTEEMTDLHFTIKTEEEDDEEPDNAADSPIVTNDDSNTPTNLTMANSLLSNAMKAKLISMNKQAHIPDRPITRDESFTLKVCKHFWPKTLRPFAL